MIVPKMSEDEVVKEILQDFKTVKKNLEYDVQKARRIAIKSKEKHCCRLFPHTSNRKNKWLILVNYHKNYFQYRAIVYYVDKSGLNAFVMESDEKSLIHYSSHFLERYNQRFLRLENASKLDLLKRFMSKNYKSSNQYVSDTHYHQNQFFSILKEGVGLGYAEELENGIISRFRTFITDEMVLEHQRPTYEQARMNYNTYLLEPNEVRRWCMSA